MTERAKHIPGRHVNRNRTRLWRVVVTTPDGEERLLRLTGTYEQTRQYVESARRYWTPGYRFRQERVP